MGRAKAPSNYQHELDIVRPPRVQITYDVEENGVEAKKDLPCVVGILAGLSGDRPEAELGKLEKRQFKPIDRDNLDALMADDFQPQLRLTVPDEITGSGKDLRVNLRFTGMDDFAPHAIIEQVPALKALMDARKQLDTLLAQMSTKEDLADLLQKVLKDTQTRAAVAAEVGTRQPEGK